VLGEFEVSFETGSHAQRRPFVEVRFWVVRTGYLSDSTPLVLSSLYGDTEKAES
jgi:hypothetical protein